MCVWPLHWRYHIALHCWSFLPQIDGILAARNSSDVSHVNTMKTTFLECWDGLRKSGQAAAGPGAAGGDSWVLLLGATNKPEALDPAVDRRMSLRVCVPLPDAAGRADILRLLLRRERAEAGVDAAAVAARTGGYSGSYMKEVVRIAALIPIQEKFLRETAAGGGGEEGGGRAVRPISTADLLAALEDARPSGLDAWEYGRGASHSAADAGAARAREREAGSSGSGGGGGGGSKVVAAAWKSANSASPVGVGGGSAPRGSSPG